MHQLTASELCDSADRGQREVWRRKQKNEGQQQQQHLHSRGEKITFGKPATVFFLVLVATLTFLAPSTAFQVQQRSRGRFSVSPQKKLKGHHDVIHTTRTRTAFLHSSLDDDPEMIEEEEILYAPKTERNAFLSEAEQAARANELAADGDNNNNNKSIELQEEVSKSFLSYALSIIMGRAIPDARDGLKPVHRRILYAMDQLSLQPSSSHRKCARVVGEVLGKFHPHGDMAVYDALVRLAQDFNTNHPLVDGHGNFGSIDADPAAAMRYTECRLSRISQEALLQDIQEDTVDFVPNFDGNEVEPNVLPARLPILLLNGASGIAVGMATNIPPHNLNEVMEACTELVKGRQRKRNVSDRRLFTIIPAPDFPTGASILGTDGAKKLYSTSNGGVILRATTHIEKIRSKSSARNAIIVTELPYQVNKAALLEKIAGLVNDKKLEGIADLRDESDREGIRVVIELKRDAVAAVVLNNLYKKTPLQTSFSGNFLALMSSSSSSSSSSTGTSSNIVPQRFTLRQALNCFLDFRFETIRRKAQHQLAKVTARAHIVDGLLLALSKVDEVIEIIRSAPDQKSARETLISCLGTSNEQTDSILRLQLGQLTRLNNGKLESEKEDLNTKSQELGELLQVDNAVYENMKEEFDYLMKKFGTERKTRILTDESGELSEIDLVKNSRSVIVVTRGGYIKRMPLKTFESQGRGTRGKRGTSDGGNKSSNNPDNEIAHCFTCNDHDTLLMCTQRGIAYGLYAYQVPTGSRVAKGQPIPSVLPIKASDTITAVLPVSNFCDDEYIVLATEQGWIKKTPLLAFDNLSGRGLTIASLDENDRLNWCHHCRGGDDILIGTSQGMASRFAADSLRPTGRTSRGVKAIRLREGDSVADMNVLSGGESNKDCVLALTAGGYGKLVATSEFTARNRGGVGVIAMKFKPGNDDDKLRCLRSVQDEDEILVITERGIMVRQKVSQIPRQGRAATGVFVQRLDEGDSVASVGAVPERQDREA